MPCSVAAGRPTSAVSLVGALATVAYLRVGPLGVTAELGSWSRTAADGLGLLPKRLEASTPSRGCATALKEALLSRNGVFVGGLILGALAAALVAGQFKPRLPDVLARLARGLAGGVLLGLGCDGLARLHRGRAAVGHLRRRGLGLGLRDLLFRRRVAVVAGGTRYGKGAR